MGPALLRAIEDLVVRMTPLPAALSASATEANPNGKRYSKRDGKGRIVEAYGFDLSPLAARYAEFVRLAEEGRAEREAMGRLRRRGTIARKGIVQILETARDYDLTGEDWAAQESDAKTIVQALRRVERADEMEAGVASLEQRQRGSPHPPRNATARC